MPETRTTISPGLDHCIHPSDLSFPRAQRRTNKSLLEPTSGGETIEQLHQRLAYVLIKILALLPWDQEEEEEEEEIAPPTILLCTHPRRERRGNRSHLNRQSRLIPKYRRRIRSCHVHVHVHMWGIRARHEDHRRRRRLEQ